MQARRATGDDVGRFLLLYMSDDFEVGPDVFVDNIVNTGAQIRTLLYIKIDLKRVSQSG